MNFNKMNLDPLLLSAIAKAGYEKPTPIQSQLIPLALAGDDVIGIAQTGTGKTAAFVLPILQRLLSRPKKASRALIISPTRELADQISESFAALGSGTRLRRATIYGGVGPAPQIKALKDGVDILIACPGRLLDHLDSRVTALNHIEVLVLDEADQLMDMGFLPSVQKIIKQIPTHRQTMLFSATFPKEIEHLAEKNLRHPKRVTIGKQSPVHTVTHAIFPVQQHLKTALVLNLLENTATESVLIFTRTKHRAQRLSEQIKGNGYKVTELHSNRSQGQRTQSLKGFRDGTYQIMVATDIAARGLDIEGISHVINYDMPGTEEAYIHRIGRSGRAERTGDAFTLVTGEDAYMVSRIERVMGKPLPRRTLTGFDYKAPAPAKSPNARPARGERTPGTPSSFTPTRHKARPLGEGRPKTAFSKAGPKPTPKSAPAGTPFRGKTARRRR